MRETHCNAMHIGKHQGYSFGHMIDAWTPYRVRLPFPTSTSQAGEQEHTWPINGRISKSLSRRRMETRHITRALALRGWYQTAASASNWKRYQSTVLSFSSLKKMTTHRYEHTRTLMRVFLWYDTCGVSESSCLHNSPQAPKGVCCVLVDVVSQRESKRRMGCRTKATAT